MPLNNPMKLLALALVCLVLAIEATEATALYPDSLAMGQCVNRTGLKVADIARHRLRNDNCAIDCITKQGAVMGFFIRNGEKCGDSSDHKCRFGKCWSQENEVKQKQNYDLVSIELRIHSGQVPDMDINPLQGESDTFVTVHVENGGPALEENELLCYTWVVQDNNRPRWDNFVCKPVPLKRDALLRFRALDSDKPFGETPDLLGEAAERVEVLMNRGRANLTLASGNDFKRPYWIEVEITGSEYKEEEEL